MFATLGDIEFDLLSSPTAYEQTLGADYAEHARIGAKPRLQKVGVKLEELRIELLLHARYADPEAMLERLRAALGSGDALAFALGDGTHRGYLVITEVRLTAKQNAPQGGLLCAQLSLSLREFAGEAGQAKARPGVRGQRTPLGLRRGATGGSPFGALREQPLPSRPERQAVTYATQARSLLNEAGSRLGEIRRLSGQPAAARERLQGVRGLFDQLGPVLHGFHEASARLPESGRDSAELRRAAQWALAAGAEGEELLDAPLGNDDVYDRAALVSTAVDTAQGALHRADPACARLAGQLALRRI